MFDAKKVKDEAIKWIRDWFERNGKDCNAVVGISGGKDSTVVAALCVEALGKDRVIGVLMPDGEQDDIDVARNVVEILGIRSLTINICTSVDWILKEIDDEFSVHNRDSYITNQTRTNLRQEYVWLPYMQLARV